MGWGLRQVRLGQVGQAGQVRLVRLGQLGQVIQFRLVGYFNQVGLVSLCAKFQLSSLFTSFQANQARLIRQANQVSSLARLEVPEKFVWWWVVGGVCKVIFMSNPTVFCGWKEVIHQIVLIQNGHTQGYARLFRYVQNCLL